MTMGVMKPSKNWVLGKINKVLGYILVIGSKKIACDLSITSNVPFKNKVCYRVV